MNLHAAVVLLAVTAGGTLYGVAGAFLAVPLVATAAAILAYINEQINKATEGVTTGTAFNTPGS